MLFLKSFKILLISLINNKFKKQKISQITKVKTKIKKKTEKTKKTINNKKIRKVQNQ